MIEKALKVINESSIFKHLLTMLILIGIAYLGLRSINIETMGISFSNNIIAIIIGYALSSFVKNYIKNYSLLLFGLLFIIISFLLIELFYLIYFGIFLVAHWRIEALWKAKEKNL